MRNLYTGQEGKYRENMAQQTGSKKMRQSCILSPYLFILYADGLEKDGFKTRGRNMNNLYYADDTILIAENVKDLQVLVIRVKAKFLKMRLKQD